MSRCSPLSFPWPPRPSPSSPPSPLMDTLTKCSSMASNTKAINPGETPGPGREFPHLLLPHIPIPSNLIYRELTTNSEPPPRINREIYSNYPVEDYASIDLQCGGYNNTGSKPAKLHAPATAGEEITLWWTDWPDSHHVPPAPFKEKKKKNADNDFRDPSQRTLPAAPGSAQSTPPAEMKSGSRFMKRDRERIGPGPPMISAVSSRARTG